MSSKNSSSPGRVAILGGDGRQSRKVPADANVRFYQARGDGGNGELRRLLAALAAGSVDTVIILARWNAHCVTSRVRAVCKRLGVRVVIEP
jgi:hypothetical protein